MRASAIVRIRIITAFVLLLAVILLVRLYMVQIAHGKQYRTEAERQYVHTAQDLFDRGSIYFTTKEGEEMSAATIRSGYILALNTSLIEDREETYSALSKIISLDRTEFLEKTSDPDDTYEELIPRLSEADGDKISALKLSGVQLFRTQWRYYPGDSLSAQTIGFIAYDDDELRGRYGLERYYDDTLFRNDKELSVDFFAEIFGNLGLFTFEAGEHRRGDLVTSLEPTVSRMLESELKTVQDTLHSKLSGGVIMNPKTGEVYAIGALPNFNLNDRSGIDDVSLFRNPIVEDVYEMGSIIKPLTMAAGIDSGAISRSTTYFDPGRLTIDDYTISNYDGRGRGTVPMQEVLSQSLNTGVAWIVKTMGRNVFRKYFVDLDLGTETGIDLPNEARGLTQNLESPRDIEYATASYGQGIAMTPIETVRALATLANGGMLVTPHVVQTLRYENGTEQKVAQPDPIRVYKEETTEEVSRMLTEVVDSALRGGSKKLEHYSVAAKTGTAQIANPNGKGYYDDRYLHSFFGYFPSYDPKFIIFLYTVEPQNVQYASETLTEPFANLVQFLINYYNIPPDR